MDISDLTGKGQHLGHKGGAAGRLGPGLEEGRNSPEKPDLQLSPKSGMYRHPAPRPRPACAPAP